MCGRTTGKMAAIEDGCPHEDTKSTSVKDILLGRGSARRERGRQTRIRFGGDPGEEATCPSCIEKPGSQGKKSAFTRKGTSGHLRCGCTGAGRGRPAACCRMTATVPGGPSATRLQPLGAPRVRCRAEFDVGATAADLGAAARSGTDHRWVLVQVACAWDTTAVAWSAGAWKKSKLSSFGARVCARVARVRKGAAEDLGQFWRRMHRTGHKWLRLTGGGLEVRRLTKLQSYAGHLARTSPGLLWDAPRTRRLA